jgi:hypothetical protein
VSPLTIGGSPIKIDLDVPDVDAFAEQAIRAGATLVRPIADQFYGDRAGDIKDPFGYTWKISTHIKDVPIEDMQKEVDKFAQEEAAKKEKLTRPPLRTVTPYFTVHRPAELIDFVTRLSVRSSISDSRLSRRMHAVSIGDSMVMIKGLSTLVLSQPQSIFTCLTLTMLSGSCRCWR